MSNELLNWMPTPDKLNQMLIYMINSYTDEKYGTTGDFDVVKEDIMSATGMSEAHFAAIQDELDFVAFAKEEQESHLDANKPIVMRTLDDLENYLEDNGWRVGWTPDVWLVMKTSPAGEDYRFKLFHNGNLEKAIQGIKQTASEFDVEKHVARWMEARNNGDFHSTRLSGLPNEQELAEDAVSIQKMLEALAGGVSFGEKTVDEKLADAVSKCEALNNGAQGKDDVGFGK